MKKIVNCTEANKTGFIIIKIINELLTEENVNHFISTYDFNSFCTESVVINMRDIVKNKLLEYLNIFKKESSVSSGTRKTVSFKNKSEKKKEIVELMKPRKTSIMKSNIHSLDSRKVMNLVIDEFFNKSEQTKFKNNVPKNNRSEAKSFYYEISESMNESRISCVSKDFKQSDLLNSDDEMPKQGNGNFLNESDLDRKSYNEERHSRINPNRTVHESKNPNKNYPNKRNDLNESDINTKQEGEHLNRSNEDHLNYPKEETNYKVIMNKFEDYNSGNNHIPKDLPVIIEENKNQEMNNAENSESISKPEKEIKDDNIPESKAESKQDDKLIYTTITETIDLELDLNEESDNKLVKPPKPLKCSKIEKDISSHKTNDHNFVDKYEEKVTLREKKVDESTKILEIQLRKEFNNNPNKLSHKQYWIETHKPKTVISNEGKIVKENVNQEKDNCMSCMGPNSKCLIF